MQDPDRTEATIIDGTHPHHTRQAFTMKSFHTTTILAWVALVLSSSTPVYGFLPKAPAKAGKSALEDEAVAIYNDKFPFGREPLKDSPLTKFGMPTTDSNRKQYKSPGKRFTDISEKDARAAFAELSKVYGAENALEMTKAQPLCLSFDRKVFAATFKEYATIFGEDETVAMVRRNPGLIAVRPEQAATANDQTMQASYLIAATRPLGPVLLWTLLGLVMVPAIEGITGIPISIVKRL